MGFFLSANDGMAWTIASGGLRHWVYIVIGMVVLFMVVVAFALLRACSDREDAYEGEDL